jgi:hypothetical protein
MGKVNLVCVILIYLHNRMQRLWMDIRLNITKLCMIIDNVAFITRTRTIRYNNTVVLCQLIMKVTELDNFFSTPNNFSSNHNCELLSNVI